MRGQGSQLQRILYRLILFAVLMFFSTAQLLFAEEVRRTSPPLRTIITGDDRIAVLVMEKLAEDTRFVFVERDEIQISTRELRFADSALTQRTLTKRYPHADLFAVICRDSTDVSPRLIVFNGKRGIRLASVDLPNDPKSAAEAVRVQLHMAAELSSGSGKHSFSIAAARFVGISPDQRRKIQSLMPEIENALTRNGKLILLEREGLYEVLKERYLSELSFTAGPANIQLRIEFQQGENSEVISAVFRYTDSAGVLLAEKRIDDILHADWKNTDIVPEKLIFPDPDPIRESENLAREADFLQKRNLDYARQARLLSAAVVLNPDHDPYREKLLVASVEMLAGRIAPAEKRFRVECFYLLEMAERQKQESGDSRIFLHLYKFPRVLESCLGTPNPAIQREGRDLLRRFREQYTDALRTNFVPLRKPQSESEENAFEELRRNVVSNNQTFYADDPESFPRDRFGEMAAYLRYRQTLPVELRINMRQLEARYTLSYLSDNGNKLLKYHPEIIEILLADPDYDFQGLGRLLGLYRQFQEFGDTDALRKDVRRWRDEQSAVLHPDRHHTVNSRLWFGSFVQYYSEPKHTSAASTPVSSVPAAREKTPPKKSPPKESPLTFESWKIPSSKNGRCSISASCSDGENLYLFQTHGELYQVDLKTGASRRLPLPDQRSNNIEGMTTNGRYLLLTRLNAINGVIGGATITVFDLKDNSFWEIPDLPYFRIEGLAILGGRIYSAGEMELFSCDLRGKNRRVELSNRREYSQNELEKLERYQVTSLRPVESLHSLLVGVYLSFADQPGRHPVYLLDAETGRLSKLPLESVYMTQTTAEGALIYESYGKGLFRLILPDGSPELLINMSEHKAAGIPQIRRNGVSCWSEKLVWYSRAAARIDSADDVQIFEFPWPAIDDTGKTYPVKDESAVVRVSNNGARLFKLRFEEKP